MNKLKFVFAVILTVALPTLASADIILSVGELVGQTHIPRTTVQTGVTNIGATASYGNSIIVAGTAGGNAVVQTIDKTTGALGALVVLRADGPNTGFNDVREIQIVNGTPKIIGSAHTVNPTGGNSIQGAAWDLDGGVTIVRGNGEGGLVSGNAAGIVVGGTNNAHPGIGVLGGGMVELPLPGNLIGGFGLGISADGRWIAGGDDGGAQAWYSDAPDSLMFAVQDFPFQAPAVGDSPYALDKVLLDPNSNNYIGFGRYFNGDAFADGIGAWNLSNGGSLVQDFGLGTLMDADIFGGNILLTMNGSEFGFAQTLYTNERLTAEDILGGGNLYFAKNSLFEGSAGFVGLNNGGGITFASFETTGVPEPSSMCMLATAALFLLATWRRRRQLAV